MQLLSAQASLIEFRCFQAKTVILTSVDYFPSVPLQAIFVVFWVAKTENPVDQKTVKLTSASFLATTSGSLIQASFTQKIQRHFVAYRLFHVRVEERPVTGWEQAFFKEAFVFQSVFLLKQADSISRPFKGWPQLIRAWNHKFLIFSKYAQNLPRPSTGWVKRVDAFFCNTLFFQIQTQVFPRPVSGWNLFKIANITITSERGAVATKVIFLSHKQLFNQRTYLVSALKMPFLGWSSVAFAVATVVGRQKFSWAVSRPGSWPRIDFINSEILNMIRVQTFQEISSLHFTLPSQNSEIQIIYESSLAEIFAKFAAGEMNTNIVVNGFLKNLKVYCEINSLPESTIPDFDVSETRAQQQQKAINYEWQSPRYELKLLSSLNGDLWHVRGKISLIHSAGYPYRIHDLLDLLTANLAEEIGGEVKLGVQLDDVGYGLPTSLDVIAISGSITREIHLVQSSLNLLI